MSFDPERYATGLRAINEKERTEIAGRTEAARREARCLAEEIGHNDPAINKIFLFGSLVAGTPTNARFDIDLALVGGDVYAAMERAESSSWPVDIVNLDRLPDHVRDRILREGLVLYRRL